jgi:hypothetical protein
MRKLLILLVLLVSVTAGIAPRTIVDRIGIFKVIVNREQVYPVTVLSAAPYAALAGSVYVQLDTLIDLANWGGIEHNNKYTGRPEALRRFRVWTPQWEARNVFVWKDTLDGGDSVWIARLDHTNIVRGQPGSGTGQIDLTTAANTDTVVLSKDWDSRPIWNGRYGAIVFNTDDSRDENYDTYRDVFKEFNWRYTIYTNGGTLGGSGKMTAAEVVTMADEEFEFGSHTLGHWSNSYYTTQVPRLWGPANVTQNIGDLDSTFLSLQANSLYWETEQETVGVWPDSAYATSGYYVSPTGVAVPTINISTGQNGLPAIQLDAANENYRMRGLGADTDENEWTFFFVLDPNSFSGSHQLFDSDVGTTDGDMEIYIHHSADNLMRTRTDDDGWTTWPAPDLGPQILCWVFDNGGQECYRQGKPLTAGAGGTYTNQKLDTAARFFENLGGASNYSGEAMEILIYQGAMSTEDRERVEGYLAHKWGLVDSLHFAHPYKFDPPRFEQYGISLLHTEIAGNKSVLENIMNWDAANDWRGTDHEVVSYAYAGGGRWAHDELAVAVGMMGHTSGRAGVKAPADSVAANRGFAYSPPTWHHLDPYLMAVTYMATSIVDQTGDTASDHDTTESNMRSSLTAVLEHANVSLWANPLIFITWHNDASENVTEGHLRHMLQAVEDASDSLWVTTTGEAIKYWRDAHKDLEPEEVRSWQ